MGALVLDDQQPVIVQPRHEVGIEPAGRGRQPERGRIARRVPDPEPDAGQAVDRLGALDFLAVLCAVEGGNPVGERARARVMPTLGEAFEDYMAADPNRKESTNRHYRNEVRLYLGDWLARPLDAITRRDVEARFNRVTREAGWSPANQIVSLLRSIYRRNCVDIEGLHNPADQWLAGGGRYHRPARRRIPAPAEVLPRWRKGIEDAVRNPATRDALWFGLYTGMRREEVLTLRWERIDIAVLTFRVEETKTGEPLELPLTRQLGVCAVERQDTRADRVGVHWGRRTRRGRRDPGSAPAAQRYSVARETPSAAAASAALNPWRRVPRQRWTASRLCAASPCSAPQRRDAKAAPRVICRDRLKVCMGVLLHAARSTPTASETPHPSFKGRVSHLSERGQDGTGNGRVIHSARTVGGGAGSPVPAARQWPPHRFPER